MAIWFVLDDNNWYSYELTLALQPSPGLSIILSKPSSHWKLITGCNSTMDDVDVAFGDPVFHVILQITPCLRLIYFDEGNADH